MPKEVAVVEYLDSPVDVYVLMTAAYTFISVSDIGVATVGLDDWIKRKMASGIN